MRVVRTLSILLVAVMASACASMGSPGSTTTVAGYTTTAGSSDLFEIQSSQLALAKSQDPKVRQIAQQMIADHTMSSQKMMALLAANNLPQPPKALLPHHKTQLNNLQMSGNFDRDYLDAQDTAHKEAITLHETYAKMGDNAQLRDFASSLLPTLNHHYHMVEQAEGK